MRFSRKTDRSVKFSFVASRFLRVAPPSNETLKKYFTQIWLWCSLLVYVTNIYRNWTRAVTHQSRTHTFKDAKADYACAYLNLAVGKLSLKFGRCCENLPCYLDEEASWQRWQLLKSSFVCCVTLTAWLKVKVYQLFSFVTKINLFFQGKRQTTFDCKRKTKHEKSILATSN